MGQNGQLALLLVMTCFLGRVVGAANGPTVPLNPADYSNLVMLTAFDDGDTYSSPGVFLSKQYILSTYELAYSTCTVAVAGFVLPVVRFWNNNYVGVFKTCFKFRGKHQSLTPSKHFDFATNTTGVVAFYYSNGTLFGHTTTVLATANCPNAFTDAGINLAFFVQDGSEVCTKMDPTGDCSYANDATRIYTALVINGVVEGFMRNAWCNSASNVYKGPSDFALAQFNRDFILSVVPDAIP